MINIKCNLIKDLIPLYIDDLVSDETKSDIEIHLENCLECKTYLNDINEDCSLDIKTNDKEIKDSGEIVIKKIKKSQDSIKYTFIIFSIVVAVGACFLGRGLISTVPLIIIIPFVLRLFFDESRTIFTTAIVSQIAISIAIDDFGYGVVTLPIIVFCINAGLVGGKIFKSVLKGEL